MARATIGGMGILLAIGLALGPTSEAEAQQRRGGAPAFCRSGAGHPVFGRNWCHRMGFDIGHADPGHRGSGVHRGARRLPEIIFGRDRHRHDRLRRDRHRRDRLRRDRLRRDRHRHDRGRHDPFGRRSGLDRGELGLLLGLAVRDGLLHEVLGLSHHEARRVTGRWHDARRHDRRRAAWYRSGHRGGSRALALQLYLDGARVAELADLDRDGRVDLLLTAR